MIITILRSVATNILRKLGSFQRAGIVFPQKSETSAPILTDPHRQQREQARLYNQNLHNSDYQQDAPGSSRDVKFSTLRYTTNSLYAERTPLETTECPYSPPSLLFRFFLVSSCTSSPWTLSLKLILLIFSCKFATSPFSHFLQKHNSLKV